MVAHLSHPSSNLVVLSLFEDMAKNIKIQAKNIHSFGGGRCIMSKTT